MILQDKSTGGKKVLLEIDVEIDKINKEPDWESLRGKNLDKKLDRW